jgi:hypothetical protein
MHDKYPSKHFHSPARTRTRTESDPVVSTRERIPMEPENTYGRRDVGLQGLPCLSAGYVNTCHLT